MKKLSTLMMPVAHSAGSLLFVAALLLVTVTGTATEHYDAVDDFAQSQGHHDWYYMYDFTEFMEYGTSWWGDQSWHDPGEGCCAINWGWMHPGCGGCGAPVATRRWTSPAPGEAHIYGNAHKEDTTGGNGVIVSIYQNGDELWSEFLSYNDGIGYDFDLNITVQAGDHVYFAVDSNCSNFYDGTSFEVTIDLDIPAAQAPVINTNTGETYVSIQQAINASNTQPNHTIDVRSSLYDYSHEPGAGGWGDGEALIIVNKPLTIQSTGGASATLIDASGSYIVGVGITSDDVVLNGFQVQNTVAPEGSTQEREIGGIVVTQAARVEICNCIVNACQGFGIELYNTVDCTVSDNEVSSSTIGPSWVQGIGIQATITSGSAISGNTCTANERHGIGSDHGNGQILNNTCLNNGQVGINIWYGNGESLQSNNASKNGEGGIDINYSTNCDVRYNSVQGNVYYGIRLAPDCHDNIIDNNEIYGTYISGEGWVNGIGIVSTGLCGILNEGNVFSGNYVHDNAFGILITESTGCEVTNNTVENNNTGDFGVYSILACSATEWWELVAHMVGGGGICINGPENRVAGNTLTGNGFGIMLQGGDGAYASSANEVSNNTVSNNTGGSVSISLSKYEWIESTASSTSKGKAVPEISGTNSALLPQVIPDERARSTRAEGHWENTVFEHLFDVKDFGLFLLSSSSTQVQDNTFTGNGESGIRLQGFSAPVYGWEIGSNNNTISQGEIQQQEEGVWIGPQAQDNLIYDNTIQNNTSSATGVKVEESQGNVLYCNRIVNNGPHGVENADVDPLEAYYNWWGSTNGPGADGANDVAGNVLYDPWLTSTECATPAVFRVEAQTGNVLADGSFYGDSFESGAADMAEWVSVSEPVEPGDVLELDPDNPGNYRKSRGPCSTLVAGVVSTDPGFVLGSEDLGSSSGLSTADSRLMTVDSALLALIGIVPVKVTDENGPIQIGDLLVASSIPGHAMRWDPDSGEEECGLIGKALEGFEFGEGIIKVLLMR